MIVEDVAWGVDIGRASLKVVRMRRLRDTVEITGIDVIDYYGSSEEQPSPAEIRQALAQFKQRCKVKATDIIAVAVPGYAAFTRFIKLPPVEDKKIADVVKYEAAQQIPFPLTDVIWGFQKVEREYMPGEEIEVGIFAIREEIVRDYIANFDAAKLQVDVIAIAPLSLFNFTCFEMDVPEETVVVDIGADHTDLLVLEGGKFHVRNLPLAGNDITRKLCEEFDITFAEAEKLKIKAAQSKQADKLFAVMQPVLRDFAGEIMRSLSFYKSPAKHMVLLGNATKLEGLAKFFATNLDMKINRFFDIMHMELAHDVDINLLQEHLPSFGVAMGLALQALGRGKSSVNLIPQKLYKARMIERKQPMFIVAAALLFILVLLMYFSGSSRIETLDDSQKSAGTILDDLIKVGNQQSKYKEDTGVQAKSMELMDFAKRRSVPIDIINKINRAVPQNLKVIPASLTGKYLQDMPFPEMEMDTINREKVWLLGLEMNQVQDAQSEEAIEVQLTASVVAETTDIATDERLKRIFAEKLAEQFGKKADEILILPADKRIKSLSLSSSVAQREDGSSLDYYKFILKWKVPLPSAGKAPEEAPKDKPKGK